MARFVASAVPAIGVAPLGAGASCSAVMTVMNKLMFHMEFSVEQLRVADVIKSHYRNVALAIIDIWHRRHTELETTTSSENMDLTEAIQTHVDAVNIFWKLSISNSSLIAKHVQMFRLAGAFAQFI